MCRAGNLAPCRPSPSSTLRRREMRRPRSQLRRPLTDEIRGRLCRRQLSAQLSDVRLHLRPHHHQRAAPAVPRLVGRDPVRLRTSDRTSHGAVAASAALVSISSAPCGDCRPDYRRSNFAHLVPVPIRPHGPEDADICKSRFCRTNRVGSGCCSGEREDCAWTEPWTTYPVSPSLSSSVDCRSCRSSPISWPSWAGWRMAMSVLTR